MPFHLSAIVTKPSTIPKVTVVTQGQNTGESCTLHLPRIVLCTRVTFCTSDILYNKEKIHIYCITELLNP